MVVLVLLVLPMMDTSYSTSRVYDYLVLVVLVMVIVTMMDMWYSICRM